MPSPMTVLAQLSMAFAALAVVAHKPAGRDGDVGAGGRYQPVERPRLGWNWRSRRYALPVSKPPIRVPTAQHQLEKVPGMEGP
jgi:hypothetical protein